MIEKVYDETLNSSEQADMLRTGVRNAVTGLSQMVGKEIRIASINLTKVQVKDIPELFGGPQEMMVGVYLAICGTTTGHMIAVYKPQTAFDLIDMLLGQSPGSTTELSDMERSVLGEVGNIMGSFFLQPSRQHYRTVAAAVTTGGVDGHGRRDSGGSHGQCHGTERPDLCY